MPHFKENVAIEMEHVCNVVWWARDYFKDDRLKNYALTMTYALLRKFRRMVEEKETASDVPRLSNYDKNSMQQCFQEKMNDLLTSPITTEIVVNHIQQVKTAINWLGNLCGVTKGPHLASFSGALVSLQDLLVHFEFRYLKLLECGAQMNHKSLKGLRLTETESKPRPILGRSLL